MKFLRIIIFPKVVHRLLILAFFADYRNVYLQEEHHQHICSWKGVYLWLHGNGSFTRNQLAMI